MTYLASWTVCIVQTLSILSANKITALYFQIAIRKVKISLLQAMEAPRVARE
jgi:hypothetical protein